MDAATLDERSETIEHQFSEEAVEIHARRGKK